MGDFGIVIETPSGMERVKIEKIQIFYGLSHLSLEPPTILDESVLRVSCVEAGVSFVRIIFTSGLYIWKFLLIVEESFYLA